MKIGNLDITNPKIGNVEINKVYSGVNLVWERVSAFIFQIDTSLGDGLAEFELNPTTSGVIDYTVDWGDTNTTNVTTSGSTNHVYSVGGIYEIKISFVSGVENFSVNNWEHNKITEITDFGNYPCSSLAACFNNVDNIIVSSLPNMSACTSLNSIFYQSNLTWLTIGDLNVSNVTDFSWSLSGSSFRDISSWDMSNAYTLDAMHYSYTASGAKVIGLNCRPVIVKSFWNKVSADFDLSTMEWDLVTDGTYAFWQSGLSNTNYRNGLNYMTGWNGTTATKTLQSNVPINFGYAKYEIGGESEDIRNYLINTLGWTIGDGGGI